MRMTLRKQITTALVLFGLVPATFVAGFALLFNEDYKGKQQILIRECAAMLGVHLGSVIDTQLKPSAAAPAYRLRFIRFPPVAVSSSH